MSETRRKIGATVSTKEPIVAYYQFKTPTTPNEKVRVLKKGQTIVGTYEHTFVDGMFKNHLFKTAEGKVTIKGCGSLDKPLATVDKGTKLEMNYIGTGTAKPGKRAPYLFDVYILEGAKAKPKATPSVAPEDLDEEESEDDSDELPF